MSKEGMRPPERHDNDKEVEYLTEDERHFGAFIKKRHEAQADLKLLVEVFRSELMSDDLTRRLFDELDFLGQAGYEPFLETVSDQRRRDIESMIEAWQRNHQDPEEEALRRRLDQLRNKKEAERDLNLLHKAWKEAWNRLPDDSQMINITTDISSIDALQEYLADHQRELTPEEIFFLQTSVEIRKAKKRIKANEGPDPLGS